MIEIKDQLLGGWSCETDMEMICNNCGCKLNKYHFYYCEQSDVVFCHLCVKNHHVSRNHMDWHIVKVLEND